jgi:hypothetical protein
MGLSDRVRVFFSAIRSIWSSDTDKVAANQAITSDLAKFLIDMSNFKDKNESQIIEQIYKMEPEVGGASDRISTMIGEAFKGYILKNVKEKIDSNEQAMVDKANDIYEEIDTRDWVEAFADILMMHGNLYTHEDPKTLSIEVLPNERVTLLDNLTRLKNAGTTVINQANFLVIDEGESTEKIYYPKEFKITRYKNTPLYAEDNCGRSTYGIYSISPMHRTILPVWRKRQLSIIDILWRAKSVPREHHKFDANMFNMGNYTGTLDQRRTAARADAEAQMKTYADNIKKQAPDMGYVGLDSIDISIVEPKGASYMDPNKAVDQLDGQLFIAMTTPRSILAGGGGQGGGGRGSYATELMVSNYVMMKITQMSRKIKPLILGNIRKRLLKVNSSWPVDKLDVKIDLVLANSKLELFRQAAIMGQLEAYTEDEVREYTGYAKLRDDQRPHILRKKAKVSTPAGTQTPETGHSDNQHATDPGTASFQDSQKR